MVSGNVRSGIALTTRPKLPRCAQFLFGFASEVGLGARLRFLSLNLCQISMKKMHKLKGVI